MSKWNSGFATCALFCSLAAAFLPACTPRDVQVMSEEERAKLSFKNRKNPQQQSEDLARDKEATRLAIHLIERQEEALQMLSWILKPASFNGNQDSSLEMYESGLQNNSLFRQFKFTATKKSYSNYQATLSGVLQAKVFLKSSESTEGTTALSFAGAEITSTGFATYLRVNNSKDWLQAIEGERRLTVTPAKDKAQEFDVFYSAETRVRTNQGGREEERTLYPYVDMRVRIDAANEKIEFISSTGNIRNYDRFKEVDLASRDLVVNLDPCVSMEGSFALLGKNRSKDSGVVKVNATDKVGCESRPLLDWSGFLGN